jgi:hypothetical protein
VAFAKIRSSASTVPVIPGKNRVVAVFRILMMFEHNERMPAQRCSVCAIFTYRAPCSQARVDGF